MALFQRAPASAEEAAQWAPLEVGPDDVLEMNEAEWYAKVYRGEHAPQLTVRAVLVGSALGFLLAFTNLYVGLKTGWALGVAITACILSFSLWTGLLKAGLAKSPMTILEMNCMQSTASSAGYATGGTMVSAIAAMLMLSATDENPAGIHLKWPILIGWTFFLGILGTVMAIPLKRNLINRERLRFPSGVAAAVTLQSLYSQGKEAIAKARALLYTAMVGALVPLLIELNAFKDTVTDAATGAVDTIRRPLFEGSSAIFDWLPARGSQDGKPFAPSDWTLVLDHNPVMVAAGAIVGLRVSVSMVLAGLALAYAVGPMAYEWAWDSPVTGELIRGATKPYRAWKEIGIWLGVPIMVASGLLSFALQGGTIARAFQGLTGGGAQDSVVRATEVPFSWFAIGTAAAGAAVVWLAAGAFGIPWYFGVLAVALTFALALVACRATGESDITPTGAMGKIMQLTYGVLIPQSMTANLMTASITASSAGSAADLLNDLKSGYLLGANPRRQFVAQIMGVFSGTIATVTGFYLLVPDATALLGTDSRAPEFPAPAAQAWKAVAEVFKHGLASMHPMHRQAMFWGLGIGVLLTLAERAAPKSKTWIPSATGIGLGLILPFQYPLSMLIGAGIAAVWTHLNKEGAKDYLVPSASGLIAGISIMGVIVAALNNLVFAG